MVIVFLPAYNEEEALAAVVRKFDGEFKKAGEAYRVVVLDDGSTDRTAVLAGELSKNYPLELLRHSVNRGLGQTMIDGLKHCAGIAAAEDLIVTLDCDDTHEPKYVHGAMAKIKEGYDVVILSRYQKDGGERGLSRWKSFLSRGAGLFLKIFFPISGVREYSCGYRVTKASVLQEAFRRFGERFIRLPQMGFVATAEILIQFRRMGCRITEAPFVLNYGQKAGKSKNRPLKTIMGYFALVAIYWGRKDGRAGSAQCQRRKRALSDVG
ncbi:MAG: glycosyltransferase family 2 protein [Candidatus Omnitrophica bacterium]|nr:glycosyltransferase family 2 protein [Candidatus Omnitrophota bacterium]